MARFDRRGRGSRRDGRQDRPGENLADEAAPLVHESVHWLMQRIPAARLARLRQAALDRRSWGAEAWSLLREALPTAIGQGVAGLTCGRDDCSLRAPWYHTAPVDRYAGRVFPRIKHALERDGAFDEHLLRELIDAYR